MRLLVRYAGRFLPVMFAYTFVFTFNRSIELFQYTDTGLYICLRTFYGLGKEHLERHHRKTGSCVYLHLKYEKIPVSYHSSERETTIAF